jgi:hypothetical protein
MTSLHFQQILPALPVLAKLVYSLDDEVLIDACWAISYLSDGANDKIQAVIEAGIPRRLVELLMHASTSVQTPALRSVGNIVTGDDVQTQVIINCGALAGSSVLVELRKGRNSQGSLLDHLQHYRWQLYPNPGRHRCQHHSASYPPPVQWVT